MPWQTCEDMMIMDEPERMPVVGSRSDMHPPWSRKDYDPQDWFLLDFSGGNAIEL